jgi:hypothetical protein
MEILGAAWVRIHEPISEPVSPDQIPFYRFLLNSHTHSALARAMYTAIKPARLNDKFQDPLYLFLELVRAGVMHGHLWSGRAFSGGPSFGTGNCNSHAYYSNLIYIRATR